MKIVEHKLMFFLLGKVYLICTTMNLGRIGQNWPESARIGRNWPEFFTLGRLFVEEPCDEALIPVDCRLCSEVIEFDLLEPPAPSSSFISDTLTSEKKSSNYSINHVDYRPVRKKYDSFKLKIFINEKF